MFYEPTAQEMYDGGFALPIKENKAHERLFVSTIDKDLVFGKGKYGISLKPREYPCWYGIENIGFIFINCWADPLIEYKGKQFSCFYVEDAMWQWYTEENPHGSEEDFAKFMLDHKEDVYEYCENIIRFDEGGD